MRAMSVHLHLVSTIMTGRLKLDLRVVHANARDQDHHRPLLLWVFDAILRSIYYGNDSLHVYSGAPNLLRYHHAILYQKQGVQDALFHRLHHHQEYQRVKKQNNVPHLAPIYPKDQSILVHHQHTQRGNRHEAAAAHLVFCRLNQCHCLSGSLHTWKRSTFQ